MWNYSRSGKRNGIKKLFRQKNEQKTYFFTNRIETNKEKKKKHEGSLKTFNTFISYGTRKVLRQRKWHI